MRLNKFAQYAPEVSEPLVIEWQPRENHPQYTAYFSEADEIFFGGRAGGGKLACAGIYRYRKEYFNKNRIHCSIKDIPPEILAMETKILTQKSWKFLSDIKPGDMIMNPDGSPQRVIKIHENGIKPLYRLTFEDETSTLAGAEHLWGFWEASRDSRAKVKRQVYGSGVSKPIYNNWNLDYISRARVGTTAELKQMLDKGRKLLIPVCAPMRFARGIGRGKKMNPYLLGVLIGDGILSNPNENVLTFCKPLEDEEIANRLREEGLLVELNKVEKATKTNHRNKDFAYWDVRSVKEFDAVKSYGLLYKRAWEKFIPPWYLWASYKTRLALAQGLMDTDGYARGDHNGAEYSTSSEQLAKDVVHLFRSLGYIVKSKLVKKPKYTKTDGLKGIGRPAWKISIQGNNLSDLFSLSRKKERCQPFNGGKSWAGKRIVSIEHEIDEYARCLQVAHPNRLYVTDDFIVTHNSDLLLGLSTIEHEKSIIFRRQYPQLKGLITRSTEIVGDRKRYNKSEKTWDLGEGRFLEFGSCQYEEDVEKYMGRPHDFIGVDELTHFTRTQYTFLCGWNRTTTEGQRCRIVATGNPPTSSEGRWVIEHFAPWLDPKYPQRTGRPPAKGGELRYFATDKDGVEHEFPSKEPVEVKGEILEPRSRTFIPAQMLDELVKTGYRARLQSLPEPIRSILLNGDFQTNLEEDPWQVIPTAWVDAAIARWNRIAPVIQTHMGVDVSRGGQDETIIISRHGNWVAPIVSIPGNLVPDGDVVANQVLTNLKSKNSSIRIDVVGVGSSPYDILKKKPGLKVIPINGGSASTKTDKTGQLTFKNKRCEIWWTLRELFDPANGAAIAIPDHPKLYADLIAPRWRVTPSKGDLGQIEVESKDELRKPTRLGRSTDYADALGYAFADMVADNAFARHS